MTPDCKPKLRETLQFLFAEDESVPHFFVQDPDGYLCDIDRLHRSTLGVLQFFDGTNSLRTILEQLDDPPTMADLVGFALQLETGFFFEGPRLEEAIAAREQWLDAPTRPAAHAGTGYPSGKHEAHAFLDAQLAEAPSPKNPTPIARLIAPHIDLRLGSEIHGHAHARLRAGGRPDVVVVLGVCHQATDHAFIACRKDFETPCGTVPHDAAFLDRLEARYGESLTEGQLVHQTEHSVEFQALWLAHHWPDNPPSIVPLLLRGFHQQIEDRTSPADNAEAERLIDALRSTIAEDTRRVVVIASVDLAHVGPQYEDAYDQSDALDEAAEQELRTADLALLESVTQNDAEEFFAGVAADKNARHICGVAPIYVTLRLGESQGELLRYGQGRIHPESGSVVSYAALSYP